VADYDELVHRTRQFLASCAASNANAMKLRTVSVMAEQSAMRQMQKEHRERRGDASAERLEHSAVEITDSTQEKQQ
jgi:hypothetical protein